MKKKITAILLCCVITFGIPLSAFAGSSETSVRIYKADDYNWDELKPGIDYVKDEILITFRDDIEDKNVIYEFGKSHNYKNIEIISFMSYEGTKIALAKLPEGISVEAAIREIENDELIISASPNTYYYQAGQDGEPNERIDRIYGSTRYDTAIATANRLKEVKGIDKFENVVVAYGDNYPDALSGGYLASVKNAPMLLVNPDNEMKVFKYIKTYLAPEGTVYILGGESVVSKNFEKMLGSNAKRLAGRNRYLTNLAILKEAGMPKDSDNRVCLCSGNGYADSLSASATGMPILLVGDSLTKEQKQYLKDAKICWFDLIGGEAAISKKTQDEIEKIYHPDEYFSQTVVRVYRRAGTDRIATSIEVAKMYRGEKEAPLNKPVPTSVVLAYSNNYADGLAGSTLADALNAPIILIDNKPGSIEKVKAYLKDTGIETIYVLGGSGLISDATVRSLK